ncbi:MAG: DUF167 domain-containing protein [Anaerolineales bacterium]
MPKTSRDPNSSVLFQVKVVPKAKKDQILGFMGDGTLKIQVAAPPVDGKANQALVKLLAKTFDVPAFQVSITSGKQSRRKMIKIDGISPQEYQTLIDALNL